MPSVDSLPDYYPPRYMAHKAPDSRETTQKTLGQEIRDHVVTRSFGYTLSSRRESFFYSLLSRYPLFFDLAGQGVSWLNNMGEATLLDVGCGNGAFLALMRKLGWRVSGVDPSEEAVRYAREVLKLDDVYQGTIDVVPVRGRGWDVITMNHVIEHIPTPVDTLKGCGDRLATQGKLVIVTPNAESLSLRLFGRDWIHLDPPRHLNLFSAAALRACVEKAGFRVAEMRTPAAGAQYAFHASRRLRHHGILRDGVLGPIPMGLGRAAGLSYWHMQYILTQFLPVGEEILLTATKVDA